MFMLLSLDFCAVSVKNYQVSNRMKFCGRSNILFGAFIFRISVAAAKPIDLTLTESEKKILTSACRGRIFLICPSLKRINQSKASLQSCRVGGNSILNNLAGL